MYERFIFLYSCNYINMNISRYKDVLNSNCSQIIHNSNLYFCRATTMRENTSVFLFKLFISTIDSIRCIQTQMYLYAYIYIYRCIRVLWSIPAETIIPRSILSNPRQRVNIRIINQQGKPLAKNGISPSFELTTGYKSVPTAT